MAAKQSTNWKPSSRRCADHAVSRGTTLVEMLVALTVGGLLLGAALTMTLATRRGYDEDKGRTRLNQNLRTAIDLLGIEIRQAGERLPGDVPALELVNGTSGAPDRLILRRNLISEVLPVCRQLTAGEVDTEVRVVETSTPPQGCAALPDDDANGFFDNIDVWRNHRDSVGGAVWAYVYNPVDRQGEYFLYDADGTTDNSYIGKGNSDPWTRDYKVNQQCRIYLLEQRTFEIDGGLLQFALNEDSTNVVHLTAGVRDMQIQAVLADGSVVDAMDHDADWTQLAAIDVSLTGEEIVRDEPRTRTTSARFFPRNVLSN